MMRIPPSPDLPAAVAAARTHRDSGACADEQRSPRRSCRHRFYFPCPVCGVPVWDTGDFLLHLPADTPPRLRCWACIWERDGAASC